jgi:hypothetical protein
MPAAPADQVYVTCPGCGLVAVPPPRHLASGASHVTGYTLVAGSLMLAGAAVAIFAAL